MRCELCLIKARTAIQTQVGEGEGTYSIYTCLVFFGNAKPEVYFLESHRSVFFRIPFRPRSGRRAFATIFSDFGEKVAQLAGSIFFKIYFLKLFFWISGIREKIAQLAG